MNLLSDIAADLPSDLAERTRVLGDAMAGEGEFVLVWLHHAVRGHENPAVDAALCAAEVLGLPVLVYQGLAGKHRFNSDRHHAFILKGARDAAAELEARGVRHVMHLPEDPAEPSPLRELARRAALVVTEDFPAPPMPAWTERLVERVGGAWWAVDCCCVVPMRLIDKPIDRAFKFRSKTEKLLRARACRPYAHDARGCAHAEAAFGIDLPFAPVDWAEPIPEMIARCAIDHTVAPVAHTPGGSTAGYARWERFKEVGLARYHKRRNDAAIDRDDFGVSRLSPYLHHGHVSPFRIAREVQAVIDAPPSQAGGDGAAKFLDELWVWREMAHNLCFHRWRELESTAVLPDWARQTLAEHAGDPRTVLSWETLARGRTGDRLWDLAQRSLVRHGELHNNLRMTWGKALIGWSRGAQHTLDRLIDLNHRFALDGNDPNSYGGLLWCLGVFDRPFPPERAVLGTIRPRSTDDHAERLDIARYQDLVTRPAALKGASGGDGQPSGSPAAQIRGSVMHVGVIGGGISGLVAARTLADAGWRVSVFDKGRGPGGRAARRRETLSDGTELHFDHGAQYFTARDERFVRVVESWVEDGVVAPWDCTLVSVERGPEGERQVVPKVCGPVRYVGVPGMNAVVKHLAETLPENAEARFGTRVGGLRRVGNSAGNGSGVGSQWGGHWRLDAEDGTSLGDFDAVIVAVPAPQAAELLTDVPDLRAKCGRVEMRPNWAVMLAFDAPLDAGFDGAFINRQSEAYDGMLSWVARDSSKPGRPEGASWVAHADHRWSARNIELDKDEVPGKLLDAFFDAVGVERREPVFAKAHRWRFALPAAPLGEGCVFDAELAIGACGDWAHGARVEGAYLSGAAVAGRLLGQTVGV